MLRLVQCATVVSFYATLLQTSVAEFKAQKAGDAVLGGLFLIHYSESGDQCKDLFSPGLGHVEAMVFAVDQINKDPTLLPTKTLGYDIRDYCASVARAMRHTYEFVREADTHHALHPCTKNSSHVESSSNFTDEKNTPIGNIVAMIGPLDSETSVLIGNLLQLASIPAISYAATSDELSSPLYKNFFRTVPPDSQQAKVMADVIEHFNWNYVATVALDDSYGRYGVSALEKESIRRDSFCIAFSEYVPRSVYSQKMKQIIHKLKKQPLIRVVALWLFGGYAHDFLREAQKQNLYDRTWILSDGFASEEGITWSPYSKVLERSLGIQPRYQHDVQFHRHLMSLTPETVEVSGIHWWRELWKQEYNCSTNGALGGSKECPANMTLSPSFIHKLTDSFVPYVNDAVYSVAHALHRIYNCTEPHGLLKDGSCRTSKQEVLPSDVSANLRNVNFSGLTGKVQYDRFGDPVTSSYQINCILWEKEEGRPSSPVVGSWQNNTLQLNDSMIRWISDVPISQCAETCQAGTFQSRTTRCCWECIKCPKGRVSFYAGATNCSECPSLKKPNENNTGCVDLPVANPSWDSFSSVLLVLLAGVGLFLACFTSAVFLKFRNTPVVRASNRELSAVLLATILTCFLTIIVDLAQPTDSLCRATTIWRMLLFAVIISVLLLKTMRILHAFQFNVVAQRFKASVYKVQCQSSLVCSLVSVDILFSLLWLLIDPPRVRVEEVRGEHVFYMCVQHASYTGMAFKMVINSHVFLLSLVCAFYAFKARGLPENFNEAKYIGFSMYILLISSLVYFPLELGVRAWYLPIMASAATILSCYGVLGCMFGPRIYVILRCPEENTEEAVRNQVTNHTFCISFTTNRTNVPITVTGAVPEPLPGLQSSIKGTFTYTG